MNTVPKFTPTAQCWHCSGTGKVAYFNEGTRKCLHCRSSSFIAHRAALAKVQQ